MHRSDSVRTIGASKSGWPAFFLVMAFMVADVSLAAEDAPADYSALVSAWQSAHKEGRFIDAMRFSKLAHQRALKEDGTRSKRFWEAAAAYFSACNWAGKAAECLPEAEEVISEASHHNDEETSEFASFLRSVASLQNRRGDYVKTLGTLGRAEGILSRNLPESIEVWMAVRFAMGVTLQNQGKLTEAMGAFSTALNAQEKYYGVTSAQASQTKLRLATTLRLLGRLQESSEQLQQVVHNLENTDGAKAPATIQARIELGAALSLMGESTRAVSQMEMAYRDGVELWGNSHHLIMPVRYYLASELSILGHERRAGQMLESLVKDAESQLPIGHIDRASFLQALGVNRLLMGRQGEAVEILSEALIQAERAVGRNHPTYLVILQNLQIAKLDNSSNMNESEFIQTLDSLRALYKSDHPHVLAATSSYIRWLKNQGNNETAYPLVKQLVIDRERVLGVEHYETLNSLALLGLIEARLGMTDQATTTLNELSDRTRRRRASLASLGPVTQRRSLPAVEWALAERVVLLAETGELQKALMAVEQTKSQSLLTQLIRQRAIEGAGLPNAVLCELRDAALRIAKLESHAIAASEELEIAKRWAAYHSAADALEQRFLLLISTYPRLRAIYQTASNKIGLKTIEKIQSDEVFVHFVEAEGSRWFALVVTRDHPMRWYSLGVLSGLNERVVNLGKGLQEKSSQAVIDVDDALAWFSRNLLEPLADQLRGKKRLTISPDGVLIDLPWEALVLKDKRVVSSMQVTQVPFLDQYVPNRPVRPSVRYAGIGLGRAHRANSMDWQALPNAELEVLESAKIWGQSSKTILIGADATETAFRNLVSSGKIGRSSIIHLATHGYLDPNKPESQAIVLASSEGGERVENDGIITVADWMGWSLTSDLIVLSACDSGKGEWLRGEGRLGFAYALHLAGNRYLMATRWPISDRIARQFVLEFMSEVRRGNPPLSALAVVQARWATSKNPNRRQIRNWAAFGFYGH